MAEEAQDLEAQKAFNQKVIEKIESDPDFLGHLLEEPQSTLESAGLADDVEDLSVKEGEPAEGEDVAGHGYVTYYRTCYFWYRGYYWHRK